MNHLPQIRDPEERAKVGLALDLKIADLARSEQWMYDRVMDLMNRGDRARALEMALLRVVVVVRYRWNLRRRLTLTGR